MGGEGPVPKQRMWKTAVIISPPTEAQLFRSQPIERAIYQMWRVNNLESFATFCKQYLIYFIFSGTVVKYIISTYQKIVEKECVYDRVTVSQVIQIRDFFILFCVLLLSFAN